jgi:S-methylmethionine-dependent homocysteine/selenocysteine methylase
MKADPSILLIDGATGTELDRAGIDVSLPLWSARAILDAPDAVREIHGAYLAAGADAITTCTFRTTQRVLERAGRPEPAGALIDCAVRLAIEARDARRPDALVLGGVAPLMECYDPSQAPTEAVCAAEHAAFIERLVGAGVDVVLIETMGTVREARAAARAAERLAPGRWMISFCLAGGDAPGVLLGGEPIDELRGALDGARAVGVNCVAAPRMVPHVEHLRAMLPDDVAVMAYANIGFADADGLWINTDAIDPERYADDAMRWIDAGATIIGGCCGTTPATIAAIAKRLAKVE